MELRQGQSLVMTPQLQQAIKLLQLSSFDLAAYVDQELERNPLLERADETVSDETASGERSDAEPPAEEPPPRAEAEATLATIEFDPDGGGAAQAEAAIDGDFANSFTNDSAADAPREIAGELGNLYSGRGGSPGFDDSDYSWEQTLSETVTLRDHLHGQLHMDVADPADRLIGAQMIETLDEAGYLTEPPAAIATRLGCDLAKCEEVLRRLQGFEPTGLFARDLAECLALQLRERDRLDPAMRALLDHLDLLARREMGQLQRICGVDSDDLTDMVSELRALNPKPGLLFAHEVTQTVVPEVLVRRAADGTWLVELNSETLPRVLVNMRYYATVAGSTKNKVDRAYVAECLSSANWLVKSLDQRANTILKVASEIVRQQEGFLVHGVQHLRPLNLRTIAEAIGMHESTVSRVTANKYMATPRGILELKYFFTAAIAAADGGQSHSAEAVRDRIRQLIDHERPNAVLSDDRIVDVLRESGIDIARRTVAKYREVLNIPSSVRRRRLNSSGVDGNGRG